MGIIFSPNVIMVNITFIHCHYNYTTLFILCLIIQMLYSSISDDHPNTSLVPIWTKPLLHHLVPPTSCHLHLIIHPRHHMCWEVALFHNQLLYLANQVSYNHSPSEKKTTELEAFDFLHLDTWLSCVSTWCLPHQVRDPWGNQTSTVLQRN